MAPLRPYDKAPYPASSYGTRGLALPFSSNIGPFNDINRPKNRFDRFALSHDTDPRFRYFAHNSADERLLDYSKSTKPRSFTERFHKTAIERWHNFKKRSFPWTEELLVPSKRFPGEKEWRSVRARRPTSRGRGRYVPPVRGGRLPWHVAAWFVARRRARRSASGGRRAKRRYVRR